MRWSIAVISLMLASIFLTCPVYALYYRADTNDGSWNQYTAGLDANLFYPSDVQKSSYNRDFELTSTWNASGCSNAFCATIHKQYGTPMYPTVQASTSGSYAQEGVKSLFVQNSFSSGSSSLAAARITFFSQEELIGDTNVSFYYNHSTISGNYPLAGWDVKAEYGYVDDENTFYSKGSFVTGKTSWTYVSYTVPAGKYRWAVMSQGGCSWVGGCNYTSNLYLDNITVTKNYVGTFRKSASAPTCTSISTCSNIEKHFPSSEAGKLWWIVPYIPSNYGAGVVASCILLKDGVFQEFMTEGTGGYVYYSDISSSVSSNDYVDLNLTAECSEAHDYYEPRNYRVNPRLYQYGNISGGNFEEDFSTITGTGSGGNFDFIVTKSGFEPAVRPYAGAEQDGQQSLHFWNGGSTATSTPMYTEVLMMSSSESSSGATISFYYNNSLLSSDHPSGDQDISYGYVNDSNTYTEVGALSSGVSSWTRVSYSIPSGSYRFALHSRAACGAVGGCYAYAYFDIDNVSSSNVKQSSTLTASNTGTGNVAHVGQIVKFSSSFVDEVGDAIAGAACTLTLGGVPHSATYNASTQKYEYSYGFIDEGDYAVVHACTHPNYTSGTSSYTLEVRASATDALTITPIQNITSVVLSDTNQEFTLYGNTNTGDIIFSAETSESTYEFLANWFNSVVGAQKQYSIYVSSDGVSWAFSDTINFGSGASANYSDGLQKIWGAGKYAYSFTDTLVGGTKKYYKMSLKNVAKGYASVGSSDDWFAVTAPAVMNDANGHSWDVYQDSNITHLLVYTKKKFSELVSSDMNAGYELQFTAYASVATTVQAGWRVGLSNTTYDVNLDTTPTRYSVPINTDAWDSSLLLTSTGAVNATLYFSDYAIMPRSYFTQRMDVTKTNGKPLSAIRRLTGASTYSSIPSIQEGVSFKATIHVYDREGDLASVKVQAYADSVPIKTHVYSLTQPVRRVTADSVADLSYEVEGVVDLNGWGTTTRDLIIKATLVNGAGQQVAEQYRTLALTQYPLTSTDFSLVAMPVSKKLGENPSFFVTLAQKDPSLFLGTRVTISHLQGGSMVIDYNGYITASEWGCTVACQKQVVLDDFVWPSEGTYYVRFSATLTTEYENQSNPLTNTVVAVQVSARTLDTMRGLQVYERSNHQYNNTETIPLVLQLRDVPTKDLSATIKPFIQLKICTSTDQNSEAKTDDCELQTTKFLPLLTHYDAENGYTYFYWNNLFYTDAGSLLPDGNFVKFLWGIENVDRTHNPVCIDCNDDAVVEPVVALVDKCVAYPDVWNPVGFLMSVLNQCDTPAPDTIYDFEEEQAYIDINASYVPEGGENQSMFCVAYPSSGESTTTLDKDLWCTGLVKRSERGLDTIMYTMGNASSDYSLEPEEGQYLKVTLPVDVVLFNDITTIQDALRANYQAEGLNTIGAVAWKGFDFLMPVVENPLSAAITNTSRAGIIENAGVDVNFDNTFDPNYISHMYFFKLSGLSVVNQQEYLWAGEELSTIDSKYFSRWAENKKIALPTNKTVFTLYSSGMKKAFSGKVEGRLVIDEGAGQADSNNVMPVQKLKMVLASDMLSGGQTSVDRVYIPLTLSTRINPGFSLSGFLSNPLGNVGGAIAANWFLLVISGAVILIGSVVYMNFNAGRRR